MNGLTRIVDSPLGKLFAFLATALPVVILVVEPLREPFEDAYNEKWPVAVALGVALLGLILLAVRRPGGKVKIIATKDDVQQELRRTVKTAEKRLMCVGSRGRDVPYLDAIQDQIRDRPALTHLRILCGQPQHASLKSHLLALDKLRQAEPSRIRIGMLDMDSCEDPEQSLCISEKRAVIVVPALGAFGVYDSAIVLSDKRGIERVTQYAESLWNTATKLTETSHLEALKPKRTRRVDENEA